MNWDLILGIFFGSSSVVGIIIGWYYRRENKQLKQNEVKSSNAEVEEKEIKNDDAQIDLGKKYLENTLEMTQKMQNMMLESDKKRDENWAKQEEAMNELRKSVIGLSQKVDGLDSKVDNMDRRVTSVDERVTKMDNQVASLTGEVGQMGDFLNGEFAEYKRRRKKQVPKSRKAACAEKKIEVKIEKS